MTAALVLHFSNDNSDRRMNFVSATLRKSRPTFDEKAYKKQHSADIRNDSF